MKNKKINIIYPPSVTWDEKKQRPHHLFRELAALGFHIHFIDGNIKRKNLPDKIEEISKNFTLYSNENIAAQKLNEDQDSINIYYANFPGAMTFKHLFRYDLLLYDHLDEFPQYIGKYDALIKEADICIASGDYLYNQAKRIRQDVHFIGNACDFEHFKKAENKIKNPEMEKLLKGHDKPVIGYVGALAYWMDSKLLQYAISQFDFAKFVFVGNNYGNSFQFPKPINDNCIFLGTKSYEELPDIMSYFDVLIIPFDAHGKSAGIINATNPIKIYEYFATGKPVVATDMSEIQKFKPFVECHNDPYEFVMAIVKAYSNKNEMAQQRQEIAKNHTWSGYAKKLYEIIQAKVREGFWKETTGTVEVGNTRSEYLPKIFFPSRRYAARHLCENMACAQVEAFNAPDIHDRENINDISELMRCYLDKHKPDFVFWEGLSIMHADQKKLIKMMSDLKKQYKFKLLYWATEDPPSHNTVCLPRAQISDFVFYTCAEYAEEYQNLGKPTAQLLFAANPKIHEPKRVESRYKTDIIYIGNNYSHPERLDGIKKMFLPLEKGKYNFRIYGIWWDGTSPYLENKYKFSYPIYRGAIANREIPFAYSSAKIALGLKVTDESITHTPYRPFEVLACGTLHIAQKCKAIDNIFGDHVISVKTTKEFLEKVNYYLDPKNAGEKANHEQKAMEWIAENHTYEHRAKQIVEELKKARLIDGI